MWDIICDAEREIDKHVVNKSPVITYGSYKIFSYLFSTVKMCLVFNSLSKKFWWSHGDVLCEV